MGAAPSYPGVPALPAADPVTVLRLALTALAIELSPKQRQRLRYSLDGASDRLRNRGADRWNVIPLRGPRDGHAPPPSDGLIYMASADALAEAAAGVDWHAIDAIGQREQ